MLNARVQSLRGLACVMLVFYHVVGADPDLGLLIHDGILRLLADGLASIRMPLFALIAGAMYGIPRRTGLSLITVKFQRLIIPMLTVGTAFALIQAVVPNTNFKIDDWHLLHAVPVAHYWFLESLFLIFCTMAVLDRFRLLSTVAGWMFAFAISTLGYISHPAFFWFGIAGMMYLMPYFLMGVAIERFGWRKACSFSTLLPALCLVMLGAIVVTGLTKSGLDRFSPGMLLVGLMTSAILWLSPVKNLMLARLGDFSYAIFLFHVFFTAATRIILQSLDIDVTSLHVAAGIAAGLMGPILLHKWIVRSATLRRLLLGMPHKSQSQSHPSENHLEMMTAKGGH